MIKDKKIASDTRSHTSLVSRTLQNILKLVHSWFNYWKCDLLVSGEFHEHFYLASDLYVPQQTINRFDQLTRSMVENGWFQFIVRTQDFQFQLSGEVKSVETSFQLTFESITLEEFYYPLIVLFIHVLGSCLTFICEMMWFYVQRKSRQFYRHYKNIFMRTTREILLKWNVTAFDILMWFRCFTIWNN